MVAGSAAGLKSRAIQHCRKSNGKGQRQGQRHLAISEEVLDTDSQYKVENIFCLTR
jgi:hypothetical protein